MRVICRGLSRVAAGRGREQYISVLYMVQYDVLYYNNVSKTSVAQQKSGWASGNYCRDGGNRRGGRIQDGRWNCKERRARA